MHVVYITHVSRSFLHVFFFYVRRLDGPTRLLASMMNTRTATAQQDSLDNGCPGVHIVVRHSMSSDIDLSGSLC